MYTNNAAMISHNLKDPYSNALRITGAGGFTKIFVFLCF